MTINRTALRAHRNFSPSRLLAIVVSCSALFAVAVPASALEPIFVDVVECAADGGEVTVPAGSTVFVTATWSTATRGQLLAFRRSVTTTLVADGTPVAVSDSLWAAPVQVEKQLWTVMWTSQALASLSAGESLQVEYTWTLRVPVFNGVSVYPAGVLSVSSCRITASA